MAHAIIVGAGPGGAALAYMLASRDIEVTLIERQHDFAREFRGEVLMPSGVDVIDQMGLTDAFSKTPQVSPEHLELFVNGRPAAELSLEAGAFTPRIVSQPALLEMLIEECERFAGFRFQRGNSVRDLIIEAGRTVGVRTRDGDEIRGDLVVGADGRGSVVRRKAGLQVVPDPERFDVVWCKLPMPDFLAKGGLPVRVYLGRGHFALLLPSWDGRIQLAWIIEKGSFGDVKSRGIDAWVDEMANHVGAELGTHLRDSKREITHPFVLDVVCYLLPKWTAPGVLLLGDACHPMSPVGGQGINIALRDSVVVANHLAPVLREGPSPESIDAAACAYQAERVPEAARIQRIQRVPPHLIFQRTWWSRALVHLFPHLVRMDVLRARANRGLVARQIAFGVTEVKLEA